MLITEHRYFVSIENTLEVIQKWVHLFHFYFLNFLDYIQPVSILGPALEGPYVLCKELLFSQMNRISFLQLQVSMTIKTKHSSGPTWYLMANAAAACNSSIFILTLLYRTEALYSSKGTELFLQWFPLYTSLSTNN